MGRNDSRRTAEKASLKKDVGSGSRKDKHSSSKAGGGASKSSGKETLTRVPETGPEFIDYPLASDLDAKLVAPQSGDSWYQNQYLRPPTDVGPPGKGKSGPQSVSSAGSPTDPYYTRYGVFSAPSSSMSSSFSTDRSDATENGRASEILYTEQNVTENLSMDLCLHDRSEFLPGKVVKLEVFDEDDPSDEEPSAKKRSRKPRKRLSRDEFMAQESARKGKMVLFVIFRTYLDYSMAIRIHTYDPESRKERERIPEHQAIIYTESSKPSVKADDRPPTNPPIQVEAYGSLQLPKESRLDYSETFIVEHNLCVAFMGRIRTTYFPSFAASYHHVQRMLGNDVPLPTQQPPASALLPYSDPESTPQAEPFRHDFVTPPLPFGGPSSPDNVTSEMTSTSSTGRLATERTAVGDAGWIGCPGSEAPTEQFRHLDFRGTKAETKQGTYGPDSTGYGTGYGGIGASDFGGQMPRLVKAYCSTSEKNEIKAAQNWINDAAKLRERMMRLVVQPGQTVEDLCNLPAKSDEHFTARRVKVAILDTEIDFHGPVFKKYRRRMKEYKDFRRDSIPPRPDSHGTHVTSLFLEMAPDADVYVAQAFDTWESFTEALEYAVNVWEVDVISISGGGRVQYDKRLAAALRHAYSNQIPIFAATHNDGGNQAVSYPARHRDVCAVFATDNYGKPCSFSADPLPHPTYGTLGTKITPFCMDTRSQNAIGPLDGSSFAAPIAAGCFATTLLFARLIYNDVCLEPDAQMLGEREVMVALLNMLSKPSKVNGQSFGFVTPGRLWQKTTIVGQIKLMVEQAFEGEL